MSINVRLGCVSFLRIVKAVANASDLAEVHIVTEVSSENV